jgi:AcrR family transcriptional regulator
VAEDLSEMHLKILDSAISLLEEGGEQAIRLRSVAKMVGIAQPSLYHYFEDRESLITAAHARRLKVNLASVIDPFLSAVRACTSRAEFLTVVLGVYKYSKHSGRKAVREIRAELIGASIKRDLLRESVVKEMSDSLAPTIEAVNFAKERGWVRADLDSKAFAIFNLSLISNAIYAEIHDDETMTEQWWNFAEEAISAIVMRD